jgi:hypothetical protein
MDSHLSQEEIELIARACHEVNRGLCLAHNDASHLPWEDVPDEQKQSTYEGVIKSSNHVATTNRVMPPEETHNSWMSKKLRDGWRYGPVKDVSQKIHPCLLPWEELPRQDRLKDVLFGGIVHFYSVFREDPHGS